MNPFHLLPINKPTRGRSRGGQAVVWTEPVCLQTKRLKNKTRRGVGFRAEPAPRTRKKNRPGDGTQEGRRSSGRGGFLQVFITQHPPHESMRPRRRRLPTKYQSEHGGGLLEQVVLTGIGKPNPSPAVDRCPKLTLNSARMSVNQPFTFSRARALSSSPFRDPSLNVHSSLHLTTIARRLNDELT